MIKKRGTKLADESDWDVVWRLAECGAVQASLGLRNAAPGCWVEEVNMVEEIWHIGVVRNIVK